MKFCINDEIDKFKDISIFIQHFKDAVDFRVREYYKNRVETQLG